MLCILVAQILFSLAVKSICYLVVEDSLRVGHDTSGNSDLTVNNDSVGKTGSYDANQQDQGIYFLIEYRYIFTLIWFDLLLLSIYHILASPLIITI